MRGAIGRPYVRCYGPPVLAEDRRSKYITRGAGAGHGTMAGPSVTPVRASLLAGKRGAGADNVTDKLPRLKPDGLVTPEVGVWGERKYRLVANYASMFATSMKDKWECRVYVDLFAGCGRAKLEGTSQIVPGSPLLAIDARFDEYVFCEEEKEKIEALRLRVSRDAPGLTAVYINADANEAVDEVLEALPQPRRDRRVLGFCFADPYKLANLRFETIRRLGSGSWISWS